MQVLPFSPGLESQIIDLIVTIQRSEFGIDITAKDQPDLSDIANFYQQGLGNFWVAVDNEQVVGTIALLDIGDHQVALRKMFVKTEFRGKEKQTAWRLFDSALIWAKEKEIESIYLGTTVKFLAAHRFYEKNGFTEIAKASLPPHFPVMAVDTKFYTLKLS